MASPRVFISSTCYDLGEIRDSLVSFCRSFGFEPTLSEKGDVFYHPDLHTHDSCLKEVGHCHLFILIIGGRFGGQYLADTSKSIVNAEYASARKLSLPVFTFIKRDVWHDHNVYQRNKLKAGEIQFPSIDKQNYSINIFEFINEVRQAPVNNGLFSFDFSRDLEETLRKQWAGLLFEFLLDRQNQAKNKQTTASLLSLTSVTDRIEALVKTLYRQIEPTKAAEEIKRIDSESEAKTFLSTLRSALGLIQLKVDNIDSTAHFDFSKDWIEFAQEFNSLEIVKDIRVAERPNETCTVLGEPKTHACITVDGYMNNEDKRLVSKLSKQYKHFTQLTIAKRKEIISQFTKEV